MLSVLSLALCAPLLGQFGSAVPGDAGDPLLNTWILWWNTQQVPLTDAYWNAPAFAPAPNAFVLSETLLGLAWLTTPFQWIGASPLAAYNAIFVLTPLLNGLSAYWLCLTLTGRRDAALIGGLAFAPYQASQFSHLQMRAMFFMPLALVGLHRYWTSGQWRWLALLTAATVMNGLISGYLLLYFSVLLILAVVWMAASTLDWRKSGASLAALLAAAVMMAPVMLHYRQVQGEWNLQRDINEIERNSADAASIGMGSPHLVAWPITSPSIGPRWPVIPAWSLPC